jgi:hypothetical protein
MPAHGARDLARAGCGPVVQRPRTCRPDRHRTREDHRRALHGTLGSDAHRGPTRDRGRSPRRKNAIQPSSPRQGQQSLQLRCQGAPGRPCRDNHHFVVASATRDAQRFRWAPASTKPNSAAPGRPHALRARHAREGLLGLCQFESGPAACPGKRAEDLALDLGRLSARFRDDRVSALQSCGGRM